MDNSVKTQVVSGEEDAYGRFRRLMPRTTDMTLIILKGHLLVEELLQAIIDSSLREPEHLNAARLEFHQKICLAKAIIGDAFDHMWRNIEKLNNIRNKYAHNLEPSGIHQTIDQWIEANTDPEEFEPIRDSKERAKAVKAIIGFMCGELNGISTAKAEFTQLQLRPPARHHI